MIYIDLMCVGAEFTRSTGRRICDYCPVPNQHIPCIEHNSDILQYISIFTSPHGMENT